MFLEPRHAFNACKGWPGVQVVDRVVLAEGFAFVPYVPPGRFREALATVGDGWKGARAIFAEEGLAAVLSRLAPGRTGFLNTAGIDGDVIEVARAAATGLEAEAVPGWLWQAAIHQGFRAMSLLAQNDGGYLIADLDARDLAYRKVLAT